MTKKRKRKIMNRKFNVLIERSLKIKSLMKPGIEEEMRKLGFEKSNAPLVWYPITK